MARTNAPPIELDELLAAEYEYIAQTATQANEDRARVSSFYLIAVGSLVAALFGAQLFDPAKFTQAVKLIFSGLFILLNMLGISTLLQLARLRTAWYESMLAMNQIKDFAMKQNPALSRAFRWKSSTLPPKYKKNSVSYFQAVEVSLIGGLMFAAATFFLQYAFLPVNIFTWIVCILFGALVVYFQMRLYKRMLK